jgi:uncharacterized protein YcfJ
MSILSRTALALAVAAFSAHASAQIVFYEHDNFGGRSFTTQRQVDNFERFGFNDRASSVEVMRDRWEVCDDAAFNGHCVVLRQGRYPSLQAMGLNDRVSSVRIISTSSRVDDQRYAPPPVADYGRRHNEQLYEANVTSVQAVLGTPDQRCWVEREQVPQDRHEANVPAAIVGGVIGGILGHQVGGGTGRTVATVGGVAVGAALGSNIGRDSSGRQTVTQDVRRCESTPNAARPDYWDVGYTFRGQDHRVQMTSPPGPTVTVNRAGEPRA